MSTSLAIKWCSDPARAEELARFFVQNIDTDYISHSELQGPRALSPDEWQNSLQEILQDEIASRLTAAQQSTAEGMGQPVLIAERDGALTGLSLVTFAKDAPVPFAIVEDLVVDRACRGKGMGKMILEWIANEARKRNIKRLFLESGVRNENAHHFFKDNGFEVCSVVMMRSLS